MRNRIARFEGVLRVRPEHAAEFSKWQSKYLEAILSFPGRIAEEDGPTTTQGEEWTTRLAFGTPQQLEDWVNSTLRANLLAEVGKFTVGDMASRLSVGEGPKGVAEVFFFKLRPGSEAAHYDWQFEMNRRKSEFPGYLGTAIQSPVGGQQEWTALLRFNNALNLEDWLNSDARREMLGRRDGLVSSRSQYRLGSAFPGWVPEPPPSCKPPPAWKTMMLVILGLFPLVMLQARFLGPLLAGLPRSPATLLGNIIIGALITYLTMPLTLRLFGWWVYEDESAPSWRSAAGIAFLFLLYVVEVWIFWDFFPN